MSKLDFNSGPVNRHWEKYNLYQIPVQFNGEKTGWKAIIQNGELVNLCSKSYTLLPNEEAVKVADTAAEMAGLQPFDKFSGPWISRMNGRGHVIKDRHRVHAIYALNEKYKVGGDDMYVGVGVHNSIDGSMRFGSGVFTFRQACSNMVLTAGFRGWGFRYSRDDHGRTIDESSIYKKHTPGLQKLVDNLLPSLTTVMERARDIVEAYKRMESERVTKELLDKLKTAISRTRLNDKILPDYLLPDEDKAEEWTPDMSVWELYNDLTTNIWHNDSTVLETKMTQFRDLHRVIPMVVA